MQCIDNSKDIKRYSMIYLLWDVEINNITCNHKGF